MLFPLKSYVIFGFSFYISTTLCSTAFGFSIPPSQLQHSQFMLEKEIHSKRMARARRSANLFNDILNFFDDAMDDFNKNRAYQFNLTFPPKTMDQARDEYYNDNNAAGTFRIVTIPAKVVKPGGLRLFLMLYLMGLQNTPDKRTWRADQPSTEEYVIDFWFHDKTGILTITLGENEIAIDRVGSSPSTAYMMQESVVVNGVLDELQQCVFDESIEEANRLLALEEPKDAIDRARDALAFG